jgi:hypothetical protein
VSITDDACDPTYHPGMDPAVPGHTGDIYKGYTRRSAYHGASEASEPETRNVMGLVADKRPRFFIDVHSFAREIYYPWGVNGNQTTDPFQSYLNPSWDNVPANPPGRRGRPTGGAYAEYFPTTPTTDLLANHSVLGGLMRSAVLAAAGADAHARNRSAYAVKPSFSLYPAPGASDDFVLSTQMERDPTPDATHGHRARIINDRFPIYAFTMESGHDSDGQFWPLPDPARNQFRKVQREIQFAVLGLLKYAANWTAPSIGTGGGILDRICYIATAVYGDPDHPDVRFLRRLRDVELPGTRLGLALAERFNRFYYRAGPVAARWLEPRPFWGSVVRRFAIRPAVWFFRGYTAPIRRVRDGRLRSALLLVALSLGALGGGVLVAALVALLMALG